ncbi:hypothetical protein BCR42DRAFT_400928 [Absidia repens]|uniref:Uncharacterized protein n=1 Tax=Absidia repens TaxID=90262 RepID=A0A1X2J1T9_9FUNG|nr:hypothetical protein BCR42DRAFT_400928 [Absidia repens]
MEDNDKNQQLSCNTNTNGIISDGDGSGGSQFITRFLSIPLIKEGLSNTQSVASQYKMGRFLLCQTDSMVKYVTHIVQRTQKTPTYQHYFRHDGYLQHSLVKVDGWACSSLDAIAAKAPLIQQSTENIINTLILQPRQHATSTIDSTWNLVSGKINKDLDDVEKWMVNKNLINVVNDDSDDSDASSGSMKIMALSQRVRFIGGSAISTIIGIGKDRASFAKQWCIQWTKQQVSGPSLLSEKSSQWIRLSPKPESTH